MEFNITSNSDNKLQIAFKGRLDAAGVDEMEVRFLRLLKSTRKNVLIDFSEVTDISSHGIELLLKAWRRVFVNGYLLHIIKLSHEVRHNINIAGFGDMVDLK